MAKGALYWRLKDEQTGKWTYKKAEQCHYCYAMANYKSLKCDFCQEEE